MKFQKPSLCCSTFTEALTGNIRRGESSQPLPKYGNTLSVKVCVTVCRCVLLSGSENDSSPLSQSSCTLILWSFCFTVRRVGGCGVEHAPYLPSLYHTNHRPLMEVKFPFLWRDSVITPKTHHVFSPTSTSQQ